MTTDPLLPPAIPSAAEVSKNAFKNSYVIQPEFLLAAPVGVLVTDFHDSGTVRLANAVAGTVLSLLPEALVGQPLTVMGGDGAVEELLVQALVTEKPIVGEIKLRDSSGSERFISVTITLGDFAGQPALLWWLSDITKIRRTEEEWRRRERQLHAVIDAAQDAVFEFHLSSGEATVSPRFWEMLGMTAEAAVAQQQTSAEGIYYHIRDDYQLSFASSLRIPTQDEPYEWSGPARRQDGQEVWLHFRGRITNVATEPRIIGVINDVTAQKAVEETLRQAKEHAEEANKAKSAFLATMSHEIRTPMTAILGSLEYLLETPLVKEQHRMVSIAKESGAALLNILNDILDLSKIEAGKLTLENAPTSPRSLIQNACDAAQIIARQKNIYLKCRFGSPPPGLILTDPTRVRQILMNLVNNAVKFTDQGGVSVVSEIEDQGDGTGILRVAVTDTGIGLTPEQCARLFKPFSQADDSTTRKFGGTGLGLSICQRLVERMGGEIGVYSNPGKGSTFWYWIRVGMTDQQPDDTHEIRLNALRVLLLDPDPDTAKETAEILMDAGATVTVVGQAKAALQKLTQASFSVIILEQNLLETTGLSLVPSLRVMQPDAGLILHTAEEGRIIGEAAEQDNLIYLPRTTSNGQLLKTVQSAALGAGLVESRKGQITKGKLLIAEDTAAVRQILDVQLRGLGLDVEFAENGRIALDKMQRSRYGLVISDLHMPEVDGYGLIREWREREQRRGKGEHLPIVALTADVLIGDQNKFLSEGFDDYMAKPVSRDALRQLIVKWLGRGSDAPVSAEAGVVNTPPPVAEEAASAPIDHARLIEILGMDDADIIQESMQIFIETAESTFADLESGFNAGDVSKVKGPAHSLKGCARMAGAVQLGEIFAEMDAAAKAGQLFPEKMENARKELARVVAYVKERYLKT